MSIPCDLHERSTTIAERAPGTTIRNLHAEVGQRGDPLGRQQGIDELEQGVSAERESAVQGGAKGAEVLEVMSGHTTQRARRPHRWPTRPTTAPPLKCVSSLPFKASRSLLAPGHCRTTLSLNSRQRTRSRPIARLFSLGDQGTGFINDWGCSGVWR